MAMESTVIKSPPTSRAMAARSWVAVITLILEAACAGMTASRSAARAEYFLNMFVRAFRAGLGPTLLRGTMLDTVGVTEEFFILEGVRSVSAHGELELEEDFVGGQAFAIFGAAELGADQAELAGHVGHLERAARVLEKRDAAREIHTGGEQIRAGRCRVRVGGQALAAFGAIEAAADGPTAVHLIVAGDEEAERRGEAARRGAERRGERSGEVCRSNAGAGPDEFAARHEGVIDGAAQRLPTQGGIGAVELIVAVGEGAVAARVGSAEIDVGGFREIAVGAKMADGGDISAAHGGEDVGAIAAEDLRGAFQEEALGRGKDAAEREAGVVDAVLAAHQILADQRPVDPGEHVIVRRVD